MSNSIVYTLYHGTCIKYELDLPKMIGGEYLYYDWGKRFCLPSWKSILMYSYFPGQGVQLSTIDPSFTLKETILGPEAWFDVMLNMKIYQKLPKKEFNCQVNKFTSVAELEQIHLKHEKCILEKFTDDWMKNNITCYPYFLKNSNLLYVHPISQVSKICLLNSSVCRNLTMAEDRFCENDGDKSIIDKTIYPAMESTCLRPCTQVHTLYMYILRMIVFKKFVRSPTLPLLSPTKTDGWKMILFVGENTLFCKLFLITTSYLKRLKTSLYSQIQPTGHCSSNLSTSLLKSHTPIPL